MTSPSPDFDISPKFEIDMPYPIGDSERGKEGFEVAEELAARAEIDLEGEGWKSFRTILGELRDKRPITWQHSQRIGTYMLGVATAESLADIEEWEDRRLIVYAALAHDLGKLDIDRDIAETTRPFTKSERATKLEIIKPHVRHGFDRLVRAGFPFTAAAEAGHHGFQADPYTVPLNEVPLELDDNDIAHIMKVTRLLAMADHFDRMTTCALDMTGHDRKTALFKNFSLPQDSARIEWLEANQIA